MLGTLSVSLSHYSTAKGCGLDTSASHTAFQSYGLPVIRMAKQIKCYVITLPRGLCYNNIKQTKTDRDKRRGRPKEALMSSSFTVESIKSVWKWNIILKSLEGFYIILLLNLTGILRKVLTEVKKKKSYLKFSNSFRLTRVSFPSCRIHLEFKVALLTPSS